MTVKKKNGPRLKPIYIAHLQVPLGRVWNFASAIQMADNTWVNNYTHTEDGVDELDVLLENSSYVKMELGLCCVLKCMLLIYLYFNVLTKMQLSG